MPEYLHLTNPIDSEEVWIDLLNITALSIERQELENFIVAVTLVNATEYVSAPYDDLISALRMYNLISERIREAHARPIVQDGGCVSVAPSSHEQ